MYASAGLSPDTIVALSSGQLPSGVAVIRISGPRVRPILQAVIGVVPAPRMARYGALRSLEGELLDHGLSLFFPAPYSFTGEDCAEFQIHGGRAVVEALLKTIGAVPGCRVAYAGEFSRRAFLNGKMNLLATEATADIVNAETEAQRRFAVLNSGGGHAALYEQWRGRLLRARALIEAELDFADEGDVPGSVSDQVWHDVSALSQEITRHVAGYERAEIVQDGFEVVLIGAPNSGKSSLLNALARRDVAIVTPEPGTTRDLIEVVLDINGVKVRVTDTAGIREGVGAVEKIGIDRALARARTAGLVLLLEDMENPLPVEDVRAIDMLRVGTKSDIAGVVQDAIYDVSISCVSGVGLSTLFDVIGEKASAAAPLAGELVPWRLRHVELLNECSRYLAAGLSNSSAGLELRSEELRLAGNALGRISGAVDVEDLLDVIFSQFCIGK